MAVRTPGAGLPARPRLLGPVLVVLAVLLMLGGVVVSLLTDLLWFRSVDYTQVFTTVLTTRLLLFVGFGLLMAVLVGANVYVAYRVRPPFRPMSLEQQNLERYRVAVEPFLRSILLVGSGVFGLFAGLSAASRWETWLLWRNGTQFGVADAQFGRDVSYFAFTYPFQRFVLGFLLTAVVLSLVAAAVVHYLFGGVRLQTVGEKVSPAARAHLSVLVGLIVLLKAFAYYLDRYGLAFSDRGFVNGPGFTDVNAVLPAKNILIGIALICAVLFFANIVVRNILLPAGALGLLVVSAVVIGGIYPAYTQQFRVKPNEIQRERPFISRNIEATRAAYGIKDAEVTDYQASQDATPAQLRAEASRVESARLLDPNELAPTFEQLQRRTFYFGVNNSLDIDRYEVGGQQQDFVVAAREVQIGNLADNQRSWINERLAYTHGNGLIAAPADRVDVEGRPIFVDPDAADSPVRLEQPRIYFGELSPSYSIVNTDQAEIDGPVGGIDGAADAPATARRTGGGRRRAPGDLQLRRQGRRPAVEHRPQAAVRPELPRAEPAAVRRHHRRQPAAEHPRAARARAEGRAVPRARHRPLSGGGRRADRLDRRRLHDEQRLPVLAAHQLRRRHDRQPGRRGRSAAAGQLRPQLGEGDRRRLRRDGDAVRVRRPRPGAALLEQGLRR